MGGCEVAGVESCALPTSPAQAGLDRVDVGLRRSELLAELRRRQIVPVAWTARVRYRLGQRQDSRRVLPTEIDAKADALTRVGRGDVILRVRPTRNAAWQRCTPRRSACRQRKYGQKNQCQCRFK